MSINVEHVSDDFLRGKINGILVCYPWLKDYPVECHSVCTQDDLRREFGPTVSDAWAEYDSARFLLGVDDVSEFNTVDLGELREERQRRKGSFASTAAFLIRMGLTR